MARKSHYFQEAAWVVLSYPLMFRDEILVFVGRLKSARGSQSLLKLLECWGFFFL